MEMQPSTVDVEASPLNIVQLGDFEQRMIDVVGPMSGGRAVELIHSADGRPFLPVSIRNLRAGGFIVMHCEDQKLVEPAKQRIHEVAVPHVSSFYMALAPAQVGASWCCTTSPGIRWTTITWSTAAAIPTSFGRSAPPTPTRRASVKW